jgi:hypothetical protein
MAEKYDLDAPRVTKDEAVEQTLHHLALAAMYYEATPDDDNEQILKEAKRMLASEAQGLDAPAVLGAKAFLGALLVYYNGLAEKYRD